MKPVTRIEAIREKLGLTPGEFAAKLGVSSGHGADLRSGRRDLSIPLAAKLGELANMDLVSEVVKAKGG